MRTAGLGCGRTGEIHDGVPRDLQVSACGQLFGLRPMLQNVFQLQARQRWGSSSLRRAPRQLVDMQHCSTTMFKLVAVSHCRHGGAGAAADQGARTAGRGPGGQRSAGGAPQVCAGLRRQPPLRCAARMSCVPQMPCHTLSARSTPLATAQVQDGRFYAIRSFCCIQLPMPAGDGACGGGEVCRRLQGAWMIGNSHE